MVTSNLLLKKLLLTLVEHLKSYFPLLAGSIILITGMQRDFHSVLLTFYTAVIRKR
jgi:hypothetical protein